MCNRYRIEVEFDELWHAVHPHSDMTNRANPTTEVFPDKPGPVIRNNANGERELVNITWGMPSPPTITNGKPDYGVTNIRNLDSPHWRGWTGVRNRCVVPWTAFCEYEDTKPRKTARWFAISDKQPLAFFAGIWTPWKGARGSMKTPRVGEHELFAFLTCEAKHGGQAHPPEGYARHPHRAGRDRAVANGRLEGCQDATAAIPCRADDIAAG